MKTRWIVSLALVFLFLAGFISVLGPAGQTALAQEAAPDKPAQKPTEDPKTRAPHTCPLIPIAVYGGATLYEAHYFETDDCSPFTLTYVYGNFQYPRTCPDCAAYTDRSSRPFYGLAMPVPADYEHTLPAGRPRRYSKKALTPDRIRYLYLDKQRVYVKVFAFDVNRADMKYNQAPDDANFKETIRFAFECSDPASIGEDPAQIKVIYANKQKPVRDPGGAPTTVYDVTYDYVGGHAHILAFLCGDPEPPIDEDEVVPVPVDQ